jgi:ribosomal protein S18 acetylase RimI-like enzyme
MTIEEFELLIEKAETYQYHSFAYLDYESVADYKVIQEDEELLLIYGRNQENGIDAAYWAAADVKILAERVKSLGSGTLINFIPMEWKEYLSEQGFSDYAIFREYWIDDIESAESNLNYSFLERQEYEQASRVTKSVKNQSRGFHGESTEWIGNWIKGENTNRDTSDCNIIVHREGGKVAGIACVGIYGHESKKGAILWLRKIAVLQELQGKGIGRKLILQSIGYGKSKGAKRAFLMADDCNINALGLYKNIGFTPKDEVEINMVSNNAK